MLHFAVPIFWFKSYKYFDNISLPHGHKTTMLRVHSKWIQRAFRIVFILFTSPCCTERYPDLKSLLFTARALQFFCQCIIVICARNCKDSLTIASESTGKSTNSGRIPLANLYDQPVKKEVLLRTTRCETICIIAPLCLIFQSRNFKTFYATVQSLTSALCECYFESHIEHIDFIWLIHCNVLVAESVQALRRKNMNTRGDRCEVRPRHSWQKCCSWLCSDDAQPVDINLRSIFSVWTSDRLFRSSQSSRQPLTSAFASAFWWPTASLRLLRHINFPGLNVKHASTHLFSARKFWNFCRHFRRLTRVEHRFLSFRHFVGLRKPHLGISIRSKADGFISYMSYLHFIVVEFYFLHCFNDDALVTVLLIVALLVAWKFELPVFFACERQRNCIWWWNLLKVYFGQLFLSVLCVCFAESITHLC